MSLGNAATREMKNIGKKANQKDQNFANIFLALAGL